MKMFAFTDPQKQSQFKPNQSQFHPKQSQNKANQTQFQTFCRGGRTGKCQLTYLRRRLIRTNEIWCKIAELILIKK